MTSSGKGRDKFAMIPESLIVGELIPDVSTQLRTTMLLVYCYLDLRQGERGWAVKGYRAVGKEIGLQERTVAKAAETLAKAGWIELTKTSPNGGVTMKVIHNPARPGRVNLDVHVGPTPKRYRHDTQPYQPSDDVQDPHQTVYETQFADPNPVARNATGSRSTRYEWFDAPTRDALAAMVSDEPRCSECLGLLERVHDREAESAEYCDCPFAAAVMKKRSRLSEALL